MLFSLIARGQESAPDGKVKVKLEIFKKNFDEKALLYAEKLSELNDPANKLNANFDYNKTRDEAIVLQNEMSEICNLQNALKELFKDDIDENLLNSWFDNKACDGFKSKIELEQEKSIAVPNELTYLNAYNFNFNSTSKSGYLGHLSAFFKLDKSNEKWYINAGLLKVNYSSLSSMDVNEDKIDNVLIKPLDELSEGGKFLKEYNIYKSSLKISSYSAYVQVLRGVWSDKSKQNRIFVHGHLEFLVYDAEYSTNIETVQRDTLNATVQDIANGFIKKINTQSVDKNNFYGIYFGAGLTGDFNIVSSDDYKLHFAFQGTVGFSNVEPGNGKHYVGNQDVENRNRDLIGNLGSNTYTFHLVHAYFTNSFNGLNLLIGTQIRGTFENPALYVFYVGVNTDLNKIAGLFK